MPGMNPRARFLAALGGEAVDRPPVWLMRQAGRYLPQYREVRRQHGFWEVCRRPELSTLVAREPLERLSLDAAIVFSDILTVPEAMGLGVTFGPGEGPRLANTLSTAADLSAWKVAGIAQRLSFVSEAVRHLRATLQERYGILGFSGAPFTLFAYATEGGGSDDFAKARVMLHQQPWLAQKALGILADVAAEYLAAQADAGADCVQLFDTWGGLLDAEDYARFCVPAIRRITDPLAAKEVPVLLFVRGGTHLLPVLADTGAQGFSLDWRVDWREARARFPKSVLQGNVDPILLMAGADVARDRARHLLSTMLETSQYRRCIVNLGHGIHKDTDPNAVHAFCDEVARHA
ncbi:MAG: uroporphyrinogen decarboxylase [Myxococcaceae bacterium]